MFSRVSFEKPSGSWANILPFRSADIPLQARSQGAPVGRTAAAAAGPRPANAPAPAAAARWIGRSSAAPEDKLPGLGLQFGLGTEKGLCKISGHELIGRISIAVYGWDHLFICRSTRGTSKMGCGPLDCPDALRFG